MLQILSKWAPHSVGWCHVTVGRETDTGSVRWQDLTTDAFAFPGQLLHTLRRSKNTVSWRWDTPWSCPVVYIDKPLGVVSEHEALAVSSFPAQGRAGLTAACFVRPPEQRDVSAQVCLFLPFQSALESNSVKGCDQGDSQNLLSATFVSCKVQYYCI